MGIIGELGLKRALFALAFALISLSALSAQARTVRYRFVSDEMDTDLEQILYYALAVELSNQGYSSVEGNAASEYVLAVAYANRGESADVRLSLSPSRQPSSNLATVADILAFDETFDTIVSALVTELLKAAFPAEERHTGPGTADTATISGVFSSELTRVEDTFRTRRTRRLELVLSGGSPLYFGDFSDYSSYGAFGSLQAGALFLKPSWSFSIGGRVSSAYAFLSSEVIGGPVLLSTAGINAQLGLGAAQHIRFAGCLSAGAALVSVRDGSAFLTKTDPYADVGIQFGFPLAKDFFVGADIRGLAILEPGLPIYGAVIGLSLAKEF